MYSQRKLPFFKFDAAAWLLGKIQILSREDKGTFIDILATIWYENGQVKNDRFLPSKLKVSSTDLQGTLSNLEELGIVYQKDGFLRVKFIDTLLEERSEFIEKCSKSGRKSAMKRKVPSTKQKAESISISISREQKEEINTPYNPPAGDCDDGFSLSDETKNKTLLEQKTKRAVKSFIAPSFEEFKSYCLNDLRDYNLDPALIFKGYEVAGWKDSKGNQIKNWKQKLFHVWCRDSNRKLVSVNNQSNDFNPERLYANQYKAKLD